MKTDRFPSHRNFLRVLGTVFFILLVVMFIASFCAQMYLVKDKKKMLRGDTPVSVLVAKENIPAHVPITESMIKEYPVPYKYVHARAVYPEELNQVLGRALSHPLLAGDPLLWTYFAPR
jgi:Flp pilus assembly protein CpaB